MQSLYTYTYTLTVWTFRISLSVICQLMWEIVCLCVGASGSQTAPLALHASTRSLTSADRCILKCSSCKTTGFFHWLHNHWCCLWTTGLWEFHRLMIIKNCLSYITGGPDYLILRFNLTALHFQNKPMYSQSENSRFHSVWLWKIWNLCMSVPPNTYAREQLNGNKTSKPRREAGIKEVPTA